MKKTNYNGYELIEDSFDGRQYLLLLPKEEAFGKPWVWRAEFFGGFDYVDMELVARGWHVAYYRVSDMYGNPESVELMKNFTDSSQRNMISMQRLIFSASQEVVFIPLIMRQSIPRISAWYILMLPCLTLEAGRAVLVLAWAHKSAG